MPVRVLDHPLAKVQLSIFRDRNTGAADFRNALKQLAGFVGLEATSRLPLAEVPNLQSPLAKFTGHIVASRVGLAPILRSGVGMEDALLALLPDAPVYHLGLFREPVSLQPVEYYSKLPHIVPVDTLFILDPMIATGNTAIAAIRQIEEWGLPTSSIKLLSVIASASAISSITESFPDVEVFVAGVDEELTAKGYVLPGCGDVGNRLYGTS